MDWAARCAVVIPCQNEAAMIGRVVAGAARYVPQVWVVDDGSTDATSDHARKAGARIIALPRRQGKGAALRAGWAEAARCGFDWVLMLDGDGQHAPEDIPR